MGKKKSKVKAKKKSKPSENLILRDAQGRMRIALWADFDGGARLAIYGKDGCERVIIGTDEHDQPIASLLAPDGKTIVGCGMKGEEVGISLADADGKPALLLTTSVDGKKTLLHFARGAQSAQQISIDELLSSDRD